MASCKISKKKILIVRQGGTDSFWASWSLTEAQKKKKITKKVYSTKKKKKVSTTKKFPDVIDSYTIKWYYRVGKNGTWYLDKTITGLKVTYTSSDLWTPPDNATELKVTIQPISKNYRKNAAGSTAKWFSVDPTAKIDGDYNEYPPAPSISEFTITNRNLRAVVSVDMEHIDRNEANQVRLQVLKDGKELLKYRNQANTATVDYIEKLYYETNPIPSTGLIIYTTTLPSVGSYQVRAAVGAYDDGYKWSEYSAWSSSVDTRPATPTLNSVVAVDNDKVKLAWTGVANVTRYEIEYVSDSTANFDSGAIQSVTVENLTSYIIPGLGGGHTWYFRIRSVNDADRSAPSKVLSAVLATKPSAPTTWSSVTNTSITSDVATTDPVYLYWIHNSVDGSVQKDAKIEFVIGGNTYYLTKQNTATDDFGNLIDEINSIELWSTTVYADENNVSSAGTVYDIFKASGAESIKWKICTKGIHAKYSDWSIERTIESYERPNLEILVTNENGESLTDNILTNFPLCIGGILTPSSQTPISFHISITTGDSYSTTNIYGEEMNVVEGSEIYSKYLDTDVLDFKITASDVDFVSDIPYVIRVIVYTDAGLTAEATYTFTPVWTELGMEPDAIIDFNDTYRYANIRPFCTRFIGYEPEDDVEEDESSCYIGTAEPTITGTLGDLYFNSSTGDVYIYLAEGWTVQTTFDYSDAVTWYSGIVIDGGTDNDIYPESGIESAVANDYYFNTDSGDIYRCIKSGDPTTAIWEYVWNCFWDKSTSPNIRLSVYRREPNGSFVTIVEDVDNSTQSSDAALVFRDPHPSFNTCVYRIVATDTETGAIGYVDITENFPETSVVVQWDEVWHESTDDGEVFEGSILELPANIKLTDQNNPDTNLVEYIGRSRPVSYYGTQRGEKPTISCEFAKSDTERLATLRRLMAYRGDVYIREPSGLGYWANVTVSYNKNYLDLVIPVQLSITPVEGGI